MPDVQPIPCTFCRQTPSLQTKYTIRWSEWEYILDEGIRVECPCGACGPRRKFRSEAVTAWNGIYRAALLADCRNPQPERK